MANGHGGARPGAGRKPKAQDLELHALLNDAWPLEKRRAVIESLVETAEGISKSSVSAAQLLLAYAYGRPIERQEHTGEIAIVKGYTTDASPDDWEDSAE